LVIAKTMKKIRIVIALVLLSALLYFVGVDELVKVWSSIDYWYLTLLLGLAVVLVWASCLKWQLFIRASGNDAPMLHLMKLYTVGYFFNTLAPSVVAGDVARSLHLGKYLSNQRDAFISTFLERFTGLLAMAMLGVGFLLCGVKATTGLSLAIFSLGAGVFFLALISFSSKVAGLAFPLAGVFVDKFLPKKSREKAKKMITQVDQGMYHARSNPRLLIKALLLSLLFHFLTIINTYLAARSIGWTDPNFLELFIVVPLVLIISMAPITPSGLGIQEGAFLFFLQEIGATHAQGLGVGLVLRAKAILLAIVGGFLWMSLKGTVQPSSKK
jgi:glycosyltransferase 2 family protein